MSARLLVFPKGRGQSLALTSSHLVGDQSVMRISRTCGRVIAICLVGVGALHRVRTSLVCSAVGVSLSSALKSPFHWSPRHGRASYPVRLYFMVDPEIDAC